MRGSLPPGNITPLSISMTLSHDSLVSILIGQRGDESLYISVCWREIMEWSLTIPYEYPKWSQVSQVGQPHTETSQTKPTARGHTVKTPPPAVHTDDVSCKPHPLLFTQMTYRANPTPLLFIVESLSIRVDTIFPYGDSRLSIICTRKQ